MEDINPALKGIKPKITLAHANLIAKWADAMEQAENGPENPWAAAIAQFKKLYRVEDGKWVKRNIKEGATMRGYFTSGTATVEISALDVGGEAIPVGDLVGAYLEAADDDDLGEATMKTVDGEKFPSTDFLVVEDAEKPSTWHLQVKRHDKADHRLMGGAKAALTSPGGHRGKKYEGPDKAAAIKKLKALYKAEDMEWSETAAEADTADIDKVRGLLQQAGDYLKEAISGSLDDYAGRVRDAFRATFSRSSPQGPEGPWVRDVFKDNADMGNAVVASIDGTMYAVNYIEEDGNFTFDDRPKWAEVVLTYKKVGMATEEVAEAQLSESASGHAIALAETQAITGGPRSPLLMDVVLIEPGWGNKKDNHYYGREVLARDAKVFEGAKMYATDHRVGEKSVRTEVSVIRGIKGFTDDGAPIASVAVHDPDFAEATRNRAKLGTLDSLECSILATGRTKKGEADGQKGNIVEAITTATSVDWVTRGGAGGRALRLVESDKTQAGAGGYAIALAENSTGGDNMTEEQTTTTQEQGTQEATLSEARQVTYLAESEVKALLETSRLPQQAQGRLAEAQYLDVEALKTAIEAERAYIKEITGSGKPFAHGQAAQAAQLSEADYETAYKDILRRHGLNVPEA